ncbi:MAG: hypothetical protein A3E84_04365 [Gammaproteobacteria bacterium RIFCSPHIGHO2_12_FULL_42_13]|nr:MAG: hypothetical protein A3E84_04365 [Gammaproteobacteria bacterium RIFCSPHIGHO2_12_FULL_42_13]
MKRFLQLIGILISIFSTTVVFADEGDFDYIKEDLSGYNLQPNLKVEDSDKVGDDFTTNYSRNGHAVYISAGYIYDYRVLSGKQQTTAQGTLNASYFPSEVFQSGYQGFEVGVGHEWGRNFDLQLIYQQLFQESQKTIINGVTYIGAYSKNGLMADVAWIINPDSQYQFYLKGGVSIDNEQTRLNVNNADYNAKLNDIAVNPIGAVGMLIQFSEHFGLRIDEVFTTSLNNGDSYGDFSTRVGLNYVF